MDDADMRRAALRDDALSLASLAHGNPWREYERLKTIWRVRNPDATPTEYQQCMRLLANKLGI